MMCSMTLDWMQPECSRTYPAALAATWESLGLIMNKL
jgi:hypothetical protein